MNQAADDVDKPASLEITVNEDNPTTALEARPFLTHPLRRIRNGQKQLLNCHPKEWLNGFRPNPKYPLFVKGDIDGFIVLFTSNLATLLAIILSALPILGNDIMYGQIVPG